MYRVIFVTVLTNRSQAHGLTITDLYAENIVFDTDTDDTHDSCIFDRECLPSRYVRCVVIRTENFEQPKNDSIASESPETSRLHYTAILVFVLFCFVFSAKFCTKSEEYFPDRLILL